MNEFIFVLWKGVGGGCCRGVCMVWMGVLWSLSRWQHGNYKSVHRQRACCGCRSASLPGCHRLGVPAGQELVTVWQWPKGRAGWAACCGREDAALDSHLDTRFLLESLVSCLLWALSWEQSSLLLREVHDQSFYSCLWCAEVPCCLAHDAGSVLIPVCHLPPPAAGGKPCCPAGSQFHICFFRYWLRDAANPVVLHPSTWLGHQGWDQAWGFSQDCRLRGLCGGLIGLTLPPAASYRSQKPQASLLGKITRHW